tara:strand:- start:489 stop:794 length:306 start_codon:yes stop_codon:yes gene_type:complete
MENTLKSAKEFIVGETYLGVGEVKGVDFTLIDRKGKACVFKRSDGYYEVIALTNQEESSFMIGDREVNLEKKEVYPTNEKWNGKCVKTKERALDHLITFAS